MPHSQFNASALVGILALVLLLALPWQSAMANAEVQASRIPSESILDGDANDGDPSTNSHYLYSEFDVMFFVAFGQEFDDSFRVAYELRDENGVAVEWDGADPLAPTIAYSEEVNVALIWSISGPNTQQLTLPAAAVPGETLVAARRYRAVPLRVEKLVAGD